MTLAPGCIKLLQDRCSRQGKRAQAGVRLLSKALSRHVWRRSAQEGHRSSWQRNAASDAGHSPAEVHGTLQNHTAFLLGRWCLEAFDWSAHGGHGRWEPYQQERCQRIPDKSTLGSTTRTWANSTYLDKPSQPDSASCDSDVFMVRQCEVSRPGPLHWLISRLWHLWAWSSRTSCCCISCVFQDLQWGPLQLPVWVQFPLMFASETKIKQINTNILISVQGSILVH